MQNTYCEEQQRYTLRTTSKWKDGRMDENGSRAGIYTED